MLQRLPSQVVSIDALRAAMKAAYYERDRRPLRIRPFVYESQSAADMVAM